MEFSESIKVVDTSTNRRFVVNLTESEVHMLLGIGLNAILSAGIVSIIMNPENPDEATISENKETVQ